VSQASCTILFGDKQRSIRTRFSTRNADIVVTNLAWGTQSNVLVMVYKFSTVGGTEERTHFNVKGYQFQSRLFSLEKRNGTNEDSLRSGSQSESVDASRGRGHDQGIFECHTWLIIPKRKRNNALFVNRSVGHRNLYFCGTILDDIETLTVPVSTVLKPWRNIQSYLKVGESWIGAYQRLFETGGEMLKQLSQSTKFTSVRRRARTSQPRVFERNRGERCR
jgi:hypothetical protein